MLRKDVNFKIEKYEIPPSNKLDPSEWTLETTVCIYKQNPKWKRWKFWESRYVEEIWKEGKSA